MTASAAPPVPDFRADHAWLWSDYGLEMPIDADEQYPVAIEANGNPTLVQRTTGQVLLFAPDHALVGITPVSGCPPSSLVTIEGAPDLRSCIGCIEVCAAAWRAG